MKIILKTLALMLFAVTTANAQHDHSSHSHDDGVVHTHKADPPHGGEIKDVGKYHLEIVFDAMASTDKMSIYILKPNLKVLDTKEATGTVKIKYTNGIEENYDLQNNSIDKLFCDVKDGVNSFNAIIKIIYKGKEYNCGYYYKGMNK